MARDYLHGKSKGILTIHGFEEMAEMLQQLESGGVDESAGRVFEECCDIIKTALDTYSAASIPASLSSKKTEYKVHHGNVYQYAYGWDRGKDPDDFLKVCYLNYGTPNRSTKDNGQRVMIGGEWVTMGHNRGKIAPRGFISNAKRSAAQKINARKRSMMKELLKGGGSK